MSVSKQAIDGREFWFTAEQVFREVPVTGEYQPSDRYYCAFSVREPGPLIQGEVLKDSRGRARLFDSPEEAIAAGVQEVQARLAPKAYAVGLPYGNKDAEFVTYVRLLKEQGVDPDKPRMEDSYGRKWLHGWDRREDAERFAVRLRRETHNPDWEVYELGPPCPWVAMPNRRAPLTSSLAARVMGTPTAFIRTASNGSARGFRPPGRNRASS